MGRYFGGALDAAFLAASAAAAAFFRESFAACFFSAATLLGLALTAAELSLELGCEARGPPLPGATCPQALIQIKAATGNIAIRDCASVHDDASHIHETYVNRRGCTGYRDFPYDFASRTRVGQIL